MKDEVIEIIEAKYMEYARMVIDKIKALGDECRLSGDDSPLKNVWEEFKFQVQEGQSIFFDLYEEIIRSFCRDVIGSLSESEIRLLWLESNAYYNYDEDEDGFPCVEEQAMGVEDELYSVVWTIAADEELEYLDNEEPEYHELTNEDMEAEDKQDTG
ncbi:hypothetical protein [Moorella sp. Hama-1]|uniref:hypothetical protein n=1 Tax=Moorella sp. Hama-1 TaxID=2138101 RepID=UPI000D64C3A1|nr:hypothetical protein [Moorella sp. Hama-1]BCV20628.1 hypothetical protein hamaS1_06970 [Moorella sp. Hama-1]